MRKMIHQKDGGQVGKTVSHYKIVEKIGEGGMGTIYKAEDTKLKRTVALKFLPPDLTRDPEAKKRFIQEAQAASALDHPNICNIHEIDETEDGQMFICMACYEGDTVKKKIEQGPLQLEEAVDIAAHVAQGLAKTHSKGIVHRDIKPANILITEDGQVKIVDFGLAKLAGQTRITKKGTTLGTVAYMSPEQARGGEVDQRTDIWSLGVVLYEMLTGQLPFKGESENAVIYSILIEAPQPISELRSDVPIRLQQVLLKMMEKDVQNRYENTEDLITDLKSIDLKPDAAYSTTREERPSSSIVVLPFLDMSPQKDQEYFCDGMAEELINALTHIKDLRVVARTSAFSFKGKDTDIREIGRKLNVETVLEGSVRKAGNRLRITTQLVNVADGYHFWSERYDRKLEDVFALQDEITLEIVNKLKVKLLREDKAKLMKRHTDNIEAYKLYLKGRYFVDKMTVDGIKKAIEYFEQAIDKDPDYALAYAGLADSYNLLGFYNYLPSKEAFPKAKAAAVNAMKADVNLTEAHNSLGFVRLFYDWDWEGAEKEYKRAIELNPNYAPAHYWHAWCFSVIGRLDKAIAEAERALELDPLSISANVFLGAFLLRAGRLEQAREQFLGSLELDPNLVKTRWMLGQTHVLDSRYDEGIAEIRKAVDLSKNHAMILASLGWAYAVSGRRSKAQKVLGELQRRARQEYVSPYLFAKIHSGLDDKDQVFEWLEKAYEEHDISIVHIITDETFANLRSDRRFAQLLKKMGLDK